MSADNGIYILKTSTVWNESEPGRFSRFEDNKPHPVWRVAHAQAIDNLDWYAKNEPHNLGAYMNDIWGKSFKFMSESDALLHAAKLQKSVGYTEYGINVINEYENLHFYGMG